VNTKDFLLFTQRALYCHDAATAESCEIMAKLAVGFARHLNLGQEIAREFYYASYLRDIGYLAVPNTIISRTRSLDRREMDVLAQHPVHGEWICRALPVLEPIIPYIRWHHEKINGEGYPDGLRQEQFPLKIQQFQMIDIYIALTSKRPYRSALTKEAAERTITKEVERNWRSAEVVESFLVFLRRFK